MSGNPRDSKWYTTPAERRKRRGMQLTLSPRFKSLLDELAEREGLSKSRTVEWLLAREFGVPLELAPGASQIRGIKPTAKRRTS